MTIELSQAIQALAPSATMAMGNAAAELRAAGQSVIDFSMGEPDFDTPAHIQQAALTALREGQTHYTPAAGIMKLRAAVADAYTQAHGIPCEASQVVISCGAKHALHNAFTVLLNDGDEVLIPAPYWVSYAEQVKLARATPVIVSTKESENFKLSAEQLDAACTNKTRLLVLCSPSNPTGTVYAREQLTAIAEVVQRRKLTVISDEIYEYLVYPGHEFHSFATVAPGLEDQTVIVNGVSKSFAMTGWRIGWTIAPKNVSAGIAKLQSQETSNPSSISQFAALAAIEGSKDCVKDMVAEFTRRKDYVAERLNALPNVSHGEMGGAFYAFFNVRNYFGKSFRGQTVKNSQDFCLELLRQQNVATVSGAAFGADGFVRASFAASMENLREGYDRLARFLASAE
ncbi:MAG: pyridoxal phosphate-dependent aminotransferase [Pirellulales bacterium]|nr:pyridoxal phosphate-dependent aminotransferase [Pirellulales bacterium]